METIKAIAIQSPLIIASLVLLVAAALKSGKENGAPFVLLGAIVLCLMTFANPIIYSGIMPALIQDGDVDNIESLYFVLGLITNILWAVAILLISIGTFLREAPARQT